MKNSVRKRLFLSYILLTICPLLIVGIIIGIFTFFTQKNQAIAFQKEVSQRVAAQVISFINELENTLKTTSWIQDLIALEYAEQELVLSGLLSLQNNFEEIALINENGQEVVKHSRLEVITKTDLKNKSTMDEFIIPKTRNKIYYSSIRIHEASGEPLLKISIPLEDVRSGNIKGVLVAIIRVKKIWNLIENIKLTKGQLFYIVDNKGNVIAHPNPSIVLKGIQIDIPSEDDIYIGINKNRVIMTHHNIFLGEQKFFIIGEWGINEALFLAINTIIIIAIVVITFLAVAILLGYWEVRRILKPVEQLATTAQKIANGDLKQRVSIIGNDEFSSLAQSFNIMTTEVERIVMKRTIELKKVNNQLANELSERKKIENELRKEKNKAQMYLDIAGAMLIVISKDGIVSLINKKGCEILDYSEEEIIGKDWFDNFIPVRAKAEFKKVFLKLMRGEVQELSYFERPIITKKREEKIIAWYNQYIKNRKGKNIAMLSSGEDITRRRLIEKKLIKAKQEADLANQAKSEFLRNMSHEIRTPLNSILGFSQIIYKAGKTKKSKDYAELIISESYKLMHILNQLLDLSKIEAGKMELDNKTFSLKLMLDNIYSIFYLEANEKKLAFRLNMDEKIPDYLIGDDMRLRQVLINLVSNALKFTAKGYITLMVNLKEEKDNTAFIEFQVKDTGIGIPRDKLKTIFNSFEQVDKSITRKYSGSGLGTTISKSIIELMGGLIGVDSTYGQGSTFHFEIPFKIDKKPKIMKIDKEVEDFDLKNIKVLVAEDYPTSQKLLKSILEAEGCLVVIADNGAKTIELIKQNTYDIILMDVQMPEIDGYQATAAIRNMQKYKHIPIIGMTGNAFERDKKRCFSSGMNGVLVKPLDLNQLFSAIDYWVHKNRS